MSPASQPGRGLLSRLLRVARSSKASFAPGIPERGGSIVAAAVAGAWVGAGGGLVVGIILTATAMLAEPMLLDRPRDLAWLLVDFVLLSALAGVLVITLSTWAALSWLRRRGRSGEDRFELLASAVPTLLLAVYLADVLGRHLISGFAGPWRGLGVGVAAVVIAMVAAGIGRLLIGMIMVARMRVKGSWSPRRRSRRQRWAPFVLSLVAATLWLVVSVDFGKARLPRLDELAPPPVLAGAAALLVVTVDGLDPIQFQASGSADSSGSRLPRRGARAQPLTGADPRDPAAFWSAVATGFATEVHGLRDTVSQTPFGVDGGMGAAGDDPLLAAVLRYLVPGVGLGRSNVSDQRELMRPPFWEIAAHAGERSLVINWWASYPAACHPSLEVISDRCFLRLWERGFGGIDDELVVQPAALQSLIRPAAPGFGDPFARLANERAQFRILHRGDSLLSRYQAPALSEYRSLAEAWSYATTADVFHAKAALEAVRAGDRRLVVVHLNGLAVLERRIRQGSRAHAGDAAFTAVTAELRSWYLLFLDRLLAQIESAAHFPSLWVASRGSADVRTSVAWLAGDAGAAPHELLELAPWVLDRLGIAPAADMHTPPGVHGGVRGPLSYGRRPNWTPTTGRSRVDLERLRSLGYIGGS